jgi:Do/DeqQ family serine protease
MKGKTSRILFVLLCLAAIIFFWSIKDKKAALQEDEFISSVTPLSESEVSKEVINLQEAFVKVARMVRPAVVNIHTVQTVKQPVREFYFNDPFEGFFEEFFGRPSKPKGRDGRYRKYKTEGSGSGVIIDERGYILTNEHVVHNVDEIKVKIKIDGKDKTYTGKIIGKDKTTDLAIVKINAKKLTAAPLGNSDKIRVGQWVVAIGSPFGLEQTVTSGIVSAERQSISIEGRRYRDFIQTDTAINRGNSGGPLCNIYGEVIGINTAIYAPTGVFSGIGFAIPINRAKEILDDLIHKGKVVRGWLGIEIKPVDDAIMKQFGLKDKEGVLINRIFKDSPAAKYGLKRGDIIREFNGQKVKSGADLQGIVGKTGPKKKVNVKIIREGEEKIIELTTGEMPGEIKGETVEEEEKKEEDVVSWLGMKVTGLSDTLMRKYRIPSDEKGVVIINISPDAEAKEMRLAEGDMIKSINRSLTDNLESFDRVIKKVNLKEGVVFDIIRNGKPMYISYISPE